MKQCFLVSVFCALAISGWATTPDTAKSVYPTAALFIGYGLGPALGKTAGSFVVGNDVRITAHWSVGLTIFIGSQKLDSNYGYTNIKQLGLSVGSMGLSGTYRTDFGKRMMGSASIVAGITSATLQDRSESRYYYTGRTLVRQYKYVDKNAFFFMQPSLSIAYRINKIVAIAISGRYDINRGKVHWASPSEFSGPRGDISVVITPSKK